MKEYTAEELGVIIAKHRKWLDNEEGGERANLRSANLRYADLRYADLRYADLRYADLMSADLTSADVRYANLTSANLTSADLRYADLRYANLTSANLTSADLRYANLTSANLTSANLTSANLTSADLRYANLTNVGAREVNTFLSVAGIGREGRQTLWWVEEDIVWCGCFKGTMDEFEVKVDVQHGDNNHGQNYRDAIAYFRSVASRVNKSEEKGV